MSSAIEASQVSLSVLVEAPGIDTDIRDKSCIVQFPRNSYEGKMNRSIVQEIMRKEWGQLCNNVIQFGNIDFSRKWIFQFDTLENNEFAVAKDIFLNGFKIKTTHATKKFNNLKVDWVPGWTNLELLGNVLKKVKGISGRLCNIRWLRDFTKMLMTILNLHNIHIT